MSLPRVQITAVEALFTNSRAAEKYDRLWDDTKTISRPSARTTVVRKTFKAATWSPFPRETIVSVVPSTFLSVAQQNENKVLPEGLTPDDDPLVYLYCEADASAAVPHNPQFTRLVTKVNAVVAQQLAGGVRLIHVFHYDVVGGLNSPSVADQMNAEEYIRFKNVRRLLMDTASSSS